MGAKRPLWDRFMEKVDFDPSQPDPCWIWKGAGRGTGYGCIKDGGKVLDAHRVSYQQHFGPIPDGMLVLHRCDNRLCVSPNHLFLGSYADNQADAIAKGRVVPYRATRSEPLTDAEIADINDQYRRGVSARVLCQKFRVAPTTLKRLVKS